MAVYRRRPPRQATLTAAQRTQLTTLVQSIFPGISLANVLTVSFDRAPDGTGVICNINDVQQVSNLADLADGDHVEVR